MRFTKRPKRVSKSEHSIYTSFGRIDFHLTRSSARRTICISIGEKGIVEVSAPFYSAKKTIIDFVTEKAHWIVKRLEEFKKHKEILDQKSFSHGHKFLFLGEKYPLKLSEGDVKRARISFDGQAWEVIVPEGLSDQEKEDLAKKKMTQWYRGQAEEILGGRIFHYSRLMDKEPAKIAVRTQKRIWGCCDFNTQTIHLNWQIILSPLKVVDYVVLHEMCHLFVPNHSKRFWKKVEKYMPDFDIYRKWLKNNSLDMVLP